MGWMWSPPHDRWGSEIREVESWNLRNQPFWSQKKGGWTVENFQFHVKKNLFHHLFLHGLHCYDLFHHLGCRASKQRIFIYNMYTSFCQKSISPWPFCRWSWNLAIRFETRLLLGDFWIFHGSDSRYREISHSLRWRYGRDLLVWKLFHDRWEMAVEFPMGMLRCIKFQQGHFILPDAEWLS